MYKIINIISRNGNKQKKKYSSCFRIYRKTKIKLPNWLYTTIASYMQCRFFSNYKTIIIIMPPENCVYTSSIWVFFFHFLLNYMCSCYIVIGNHIVSIIITKQKIVPSQQIHGWFHKVSNFHFGLTCFLDVV